MDESEAGLRPDPIDKSKWGAGPWQTEPDRIEFEASGLPCLMLRQRSLGHWCGYVAVPPGHPLHGKGYSDDAVDVNVHGGLTYADACSGTICHVPKPGKPENVWWFGFDCAHYGDLPPGMLADGLRSYSDGTYRDAAYVRRQTERLAAQLAAGAPSAAAVPATKHEEG